MTKTITYTTARGAKIEVEYVTQTIETFEIDGVTAQKVRAVNEIEYRVNGKRVSGERTRTGEAGECIKLQVGTRTEGKRTIVQYACAPIPADKIDAIDALLASCRAAINAKINADSADEAAYRANVRKITAH